MFSFSLFIEPRKASVLVEKHGNKICLYILTKIGVIFSDTVCDTNLNFCVRNCNKKFGDPIGMAV